MLIVYLEQFQRSQEVLLVTWKNFVHYWPRSYVHTDAYNAAIPVDWWLLFSNPLYADLWLMKYPEQSRIIRTLFDEDVTDSKIQH
jgi:hypothetical protein